MQRVHWERLPGTVRDAIQAQTGPVRRATTAKEGLNSEIALFLDTDAGSFFVKGLRLSHPGVVTQRREAAISPHVAPVSPRLLWHIQIDDWDLLGFERIPGRHADYSPGSPDLPLVVDAMRRLGEIPCPDAPVKIAEQRWAAYINDEASRRLLAGDQLLHTDYNPFNILIHRDTAHIIDWAWPTKGAAWIDPCCLVMRLITAGHAPEEAEHWAQQTPAWHTASPHAIDTFATASTRLWREISQAKPLTNWKTGMAKSAHIWAEHRQSVRDRS
ncbi:RIO1 family regulatory kinase/ATPase [Actinocrinis sp.]|uniref:RIO1 family regulatory kinase/ATPase domain-containing protein n=1 Tax=Actinocrinis sp. TaxID=1920516 RepID=UPI002DDD1ECC|nr:RIO1 family regulatory kinase/ATPase [Actinocrinis sp.]